MAKKSVKPKIPKIASLAVNKSVEKDALTWYLSQIGKVKPLTAQEEAELARNIRKGDFQAVKKLVRANLRFVVSVARNYQNQGLPIDDLISEGNLGLLRAARKFDETKNFKFISYAVWWIRQAILQSLADHSRITRIPTSRVGIIQRFSKAQGSLEQRFCRPPTVHEIAKELKIDEQGVEELMQIVSKPVSLDSPMDSETDQGLLDVLVDKNQVPSDELVACNALRADVQKLLEQLNVREREIISLYFGIDNVDEHTLDDIGQRVELTRERVRQLKETALHRLKNSSRSKILRSYLS